MKNEEGRTLVSTTGAAVIGSLWLLGSVVLGFATATAPGFARGLEFVLMWLALGAFPAVLLLLVWSYLERGDGGA